MTLLDRLRSRAIEQRWLPLYDFVDCALYAPELGYYQRTDRKRVGRDAHTDFYTASSLGACFHACVTTAAQTLLGSEFCQRTQFVEIGAEADEALSELEGFAHRKSLRLGAPLTLTGNCVVFSNELFDAQPFDQFCFHHGQWRLTGVELSDTELRPCILPDSLQTLRPAVAELPQDATDGYCVDVPTGAEQLLTTLVSQAWEGLFIAFDYGHDWQTLITETPQGTARAYQNHEKHNAIWRDPGQQDITHHVCWDRLEAILRDHGFASVTTQRQESFLMRYALPWIQQALENTQDFYTRRKLMELLHPGHMGTRFQVLSGIRLL